MKKNEDMDPVCFCLSSAHLFKAALTDLSSTKGIEGQIHANLQKKLGSF